MALRDTVRDRATVAFFAKHAGYSYTPGKESRAQGRLRGARELARAEREAKSRKWHVRWQHDHEPYELGEGETKAPKEVLNAVLLDKDRKPLESLCGIADPSHEYKRVVEAELALEALK